MAKNIVIVESPAKSRTLARFLGKDFDIVSTIGHIIDLPKSKLGVDVDNNFQPDYTVIKGKEKVIAELKKAAKKAQNVYLAPDPDREGEAIAWHVANSLKGTKGINAKFFRVTFNEITKTAVTTAIANPREIDIDLVNAQQARRVLDRLVGYKVSPFLWKTVARNLSAGRVQSVALRLVCEREAEVLAFKPQEYWNIAAELNADKKAVLKANLYKIDGKTVVKAGEAGKTKITIEDEKTAKKILAELKKHKFIVSEIKKSSRIRRSAAPFITSTLQQEAAKAFGYSPKQKMSIAQKLYEGIEIGDDGPTGLITYMRTDSTRIADEALAAVRELIQTEFGDEYLPTKPNIYGKKKGAQDAHEAIRPSYTTLPPDKLKKKLKPQQLKLYTLIWNRFVASQMANAKFNLQTVDITAGDYIFRATAQTQVFDGFLRIYQEAKEDDESSNGNGPQTLPPMKKDQELKLKKIDPTQSFTKPPPRYSEAMLVKRLEADGIGRPSTYATIVSTLKDRQYVESVERKLRPTDLGGAVSKILVEHFPNVFNIEFTANMEKNLDSIEEGNDDWVKVIGNFYSPFIETLDGLKDKESEIKASLVEETDQECVKCKKKMVIKWGRNGRFLACSGWPDCKSTRPLPEEEAKNRTDEKCEKCNSAMVIKTGRFGRFMACSGYPDCKNTKPIPVGVKCPKEDCSGDVIEKQSRNKRLFFGCSNYPKCDFASWDRPVAKACPVCKHSYMLEKVSKAKGEFYKCPECKHQESKVMVPEEASSEKSSETS